MGGYKVGDVCYLELIRFNLPKSNSAKNVVIDVLVITNYDIF
jgi:hypothetical protein